VVELNFERPGPRKAGQWRDFLKENRWPAMRSLDKIGGLPAVARAASEGWSQLSDSNWRPADCKFSVLMRLPGRFTGSQLSGAAGKRSKVRF